MRNPKPQESTGVRANGISPRAFVSYSWDDESHNAWVANLSTDLRRDGIETILDQWHAVLGDQLTAFMENEIRDSEYVLIICTPGYRLKSDQRRGGVGYEGAIMTAELLASGNHRKFIPVLAKGTWKEAVPSWAQGKLYVDLSTPDEYAKNYPKLASRLLGEQPVAPTLGNRPRPRSAGPAEKSLSLGPVSADPEPSTTMVFHESDITDAQQGWNGGLDLVLDEFGTAAWQTGLAQKRDQVAGNMEAQLQRKVAGKPPGHQQTVTAIVRPFVKWLKGGSLPNSPFDIALSEREGPARNEGFEIVLDAFEHFVRGFSPQSNWTWNEIADNLEKLVEFEGRKRSQDYRTAMADVVRPFCKMLKGELRHEPPFNT